MSEISFTNDPRTVLCHFNPNHDRLGRFARNMFGGGRLANKTVDKSRNSGYNRSGTKWRPNKYFRIGVAVAVSALAVYGGYKLYKSGTLAGYINSGKNRLNGVMSRFGDVAAGDMPNIGDSFKSSASEKIDESTKSLKRLAKPETIAETLKHTNPHFGEAEYDANCTSCALAGFLRSIGFDVKAGKVSGGQGQKLTDMVRKCFKIDDDIHILDGNATHFGESPEKAARMLIRKFGPNASGVVAIQWKTRGAIQDGTLGHAFNWSIKDGIVRFFDSQDPSGIRDNDWCRNVMWSRISKEAPFFAFRLDNAEPIIKNIIREIE